MKFYSLVVFLLLTFSLHANDSPWLDLSKSNKGTIATIKCKGAKPKKVCASPRNAFFTETGWIIYCTDLSPMCDYSEKGEMLDRKKHCTLEINSYKKCVWEPERWGH